MTRQYEQAVSDYYWAKENIRYSLTPWRDAGYTLATGAGHCGHKAELLTAILRGRGIRTRYVEGRVPVSAPSSLSRHIWVEAEIDGEWLTLDPTPDSGVAHILGDTRPGTHLGRYRLEIVWDELPLEYKRLYNNPISGLMRLYYNTKLLMGRRVAAWKRR